MSTTGCGRFKTKILDVDAEIRPEIYLNDCTNEAHLRTKVTVKTSLHTYFDLTRFNVDKVYSELTLVNTDYFNFRFRRDDDLIIYLVSKDRPYKLLERIFSSSLYISIVQAIAEMLLKQSAECPIREYFVTSKAKVCLENNIPILAVSTFEDTAFQMINIIKEAFRVPELHARKILEFLSAQDFIKEFTVDFIVRQGVREITVWDWYSNAEIVTENGVYYVLENVARKIAEKAGVEIDEIE